MKHIVLFSLLFIGLSADAQNWNEWFRQKRTQIRYHLRQIAALQVYIELGQKGYRVYRDGLGLIGDIKDGEINLHKDYFASLSNINPAISGSPNINEIILWHEQVMIFRDRIRKLSLGQSHVSVEQLFQRLEQKSAEQQAQLELLITNGHYQLKDEQRMAQINKVHKEQYQLFQFAKSTYQEAIAYAKQIGKQEQEMKVIKQLEGLP